MEKNTAQGSNSELGYAVPQEWYSKYLGSDMQCAALENASIADAHGILDENAKYAVVSCKEWKEIKERCSYDIEVPVGIVDVTIRYKNKEEEIKKECSACAYSQVYEVLQIVLFSDRATRKECAKKHTCTINSKKKEGRKEIERALAQRLIEYESKQVEIELERKYTKDSREDASEDDKDSASEKEESDISSAVQDSSVYRKADTSMAEDREKSTRVCASKPVPFRNLGMTCYMNTALQVMLGVYELSESIKEMGTQEIKKMAESKDRKKGQNKEKSAELLLAYKSLVANAASGKECTDDLYKVKRVLGGMDRRYSAFAEEDAGEVFALMLNSWSYLFENTKYKRVVSSLFVYHADAVKVYRDSAGNEIERKQKNVHKSYVLNGSVGSEKGPHAHVAVMHKNQLMATSLCVHTDTEGMICMHAVKEAISRAFRVAKESVAVGDTHGERVQKRADTHKFAQKANIYEQPVFYVTDIEESDRAFVFVEYAAQKDSITFLASMFGSTDRKMMQVPFVVSKSMSMYEFLQTELKIERKQDTEGIDIDIKTMTEETESVYRSVCIGISHKHWNGDAYIQRIKERRCETKDALHIQCMITNWENRTVRYKLQDKEKKKRKGKDVASVDEYMQFYNFSVYFCMQIPLGLGATAKSAKMHEKNKPYIEKDSLMLDGRRYALVGILVHHSMGYSGHYVAFTKRGDTWYHCNDSSITKSSVNDVVSTGYPYGILYKRQE